FARVLARFWWVLVSIYAANVLFGLLQLVDRDPAGFGALLDLRSIESIVFPTPFLRLPLVSLISIVLAVVLIWLGRLASADLEQEQRSLYLREVRRRVHETVVEMRALDELAERINRLKSEIETGGRVQSGGELLRRDADAKP